MCVSESHDDSKDGEYHAYHGDIWACDHLCIKKSGPSFLLQNAVPGSHLIEAAYCSNCFKIPVKTGVAEMGYCYPINFYVEWCF